MVSVADDQRLLGTCSVRGRPAAQIHELIRRFLPTVGLTLKDIDQIAVTTGPGSWTGLNIGVTAAKVMAQVQNCPVVPIFALDALVATQRWDHGHIWAICKAGRQRVYYSRYAPELELPSLESGLVVLDSLLERLSMDGRQPLLLEYGQAFAPRLSDSTALTYVSRERLMAEGMIVAARMAVPLQTNEVMALMPDYLQETLAERDSKTD